jgi:hypothetical protein
VIMGGLGACMMFMPIPQSNATAMTFILGALAGALTMTGTTHTSAPSEPTP